MKFIMNKIKQVMLQIKLRKAWREHDKLDKILKDLNTSRMKR